MQFHYFTINIKIKFNEKDKKLIMINQEDYVEYSSYCEESIRERESLHVSIEKRRIQGHLEQDPFGEKVCVKIIRA